MIRCAHVRTRGIYGDEIWTTLRRVFRPDLHHKKLIVEAGTRIGPYGRHITIWKLA